MLFNLYKGASLNKVRQIYLIVFRKLVKRHYLS